MAYLRHVLPLAVVLAVGGLVASAQALLATEYQLQVASVEEKLFHRYVETQGAPFRTYLHILPRLAEALDRGTLPSSVLLPEREPRLVQTGAKVPGHTTPRVVDLTAARRDQSWNTVAWEGSPGQTVLFRVSSLLVHYQELMEIAVDTDGVLRRLPVYGVPILWEAQLLAPTLSDTYIATALERGTWPAWVAKHAVSQNGLAVVVGRNHDLKFPDAVYLMVQMPPEAKTYKVVLAWRDREDLRKDSFDGNDRNK
jgi:hypothetical protein